MSSDLVTAPAIGSATPWLVALVAVLLVALGLACAAVVRGRRRARRALEEVLTQTAELRREVDDLRRSARPVGRTSKSYVITGVGETQPAPPSRPPGPEARIDSRLFADLVLRESVVKSAALAHGVRRALAPETRHRIRFEMGREVKRARKQRRADLREARRRLQAEQRSSLGGSANDEIVPEQGAA